MRIRCWAVLPILAILAACGTPGGPRDVTPAAGPDVRVRVDDMAWKPVRSLAQYGPDDPVYSVSVDESGRASVTFGDGIHGRRPASGSRIRVTYRYGSGEGEPLEVVVERTVGRDAGLPTCLLLDMGRARLAFRACEEGRDN